MGNNSVIMVLGLVFIFGIIGASLNKSNTESVTITSGYYKYTQARNIAHTAINIALRRMDDGANPQMVLTGNTEGGSYKLTCDVMGDTLFIVSKAKYVDSSYTIRAKLKREAKDFPVSLAAVGFNFSPVDFILKNFNQNNPKIKISGEDHRWDWQNVNTPIPISIPGDSTDVAAISVVAKSDSNRIDSLYKAALFPADERITVNEPVSNFSDIIKEFIKMADVRYENNTKIPSEVKPPLWGDSLNPKIIFIDGTTTTAKINSATGYGILVVQGNLEITSNLNFFGLILPYNRKTIDSTGFSVDSMTITQSGTMNLYGALLMDGAPGSDFYMNGTANIYYSSKALNDAQKISKLQYYKILSWYE